MAINVVPERTINYRVSVEGQRDPVGTATVDLPELTPMTDTISGAGIAGEYDSPTIGHLESMSVTLNFRTITGSMASLARPGAIDLTLRASMQQYDSATGITSTSRVRIAIRGINKGLALGSIEPSAVTDSTVEFEVLALRLFVDDKEVIGIDKAAFKYVVNGIDYLAQVRADLGM